VVFARLFHGHLLVLPNFPGWVCDVCGHRAYEPAALEQVQLLLGAEAELRRPSRRRSPAQAPRVTPARPHGRRLV
jgi:YgiT-type zinc finger domain-containing protein